MSERGFNDAQKEVLAILMEQFWVLRSEDPGSYQLIRENEKMLKQYISEKFGFSFIVHKDFIKLEKVPVEPEEWMGFIEFNKPQDYVIFCCGLIFLENRTVEEQFLLSELASDIAEVYPGEFPLDWTNYQHRQSLVRVLKKMVELDLIRSVDGNIEGFAGNEEQEVLYEGTVYTRYFMRNHLESLKRFNSIDEILEKDWQNNQTDERRKRVYRKLIVSPVVYRKSEDDLDFEYIRRYRNRIREDIEDHTDFEMQVFKNAAMLTLSEQKQRYTTFPDRKGISLVVLHMQAYVREHIDNFSIDSFGEIHLTRAQFDQLIDRIREKYQIGWSSEYREKSGLKKTADDVLEELKSWQFARIEKETGFVILRSAIGRMVGEYPKDFEIEVNKDE